MFASPPSRSLQKAPNRGNALFLILIAVALFAALAYAVTQSGRGSGNISRETADISAAQMVEYAGQMQQVVQRLMVVRNCTVNQLSFDTTPGTGGEDNPIAPTDLSCHIFSSNGGGETVPSPWGGSPETGPAGWFIASTLLVRGMGSYSNADPCDGCDLSLIYSGVSDEVCRTLNSRLLGQNVIVSIPRNLAAGAYDGEFDGWHLIEDAEVTGGTVEGKEGFCLNASAVPINVFIYPIVIR